MNDMTSSLSDLSSFIFKDGKDTFMEETSGNPLTRGKEMNDFTTIGR